MAKDLFSHYLRDLLVCMCVIGSKIVAASAKDHTIVQQQI